MKEESLESLNKYLFSENERLNAEIDDLEEKVINAINYLKHNSYSNNSYETFTSPNPIKDLLEILGDDNKWKK